MHPVDILYITHRFPYPPDKGDRIRAFNILKHLSQHSRLWVASLADEDVTTEQRAVVEQYVHRLAVIPTNVWQKVLGAGSAALLGRSLSEGMFASRSLDRLLSQWSREVDFQAVMISASSLAGYLEHFPPETQQVVDLVDVDSEKWREYADKSRGGQRLVYQREFHHIAKLEQRLLRDKDSLILVSEEEANLFRQCSTERGVTGVEKIHAVTNGVDLEYFTACDVKRERSITFLGAMDYRPNIDAVVWFSSEVWPHLQKRYPDLMFNIVGRKPSPEVLQLAKQPGIHVTGMVDDVRPWLAKSQAVVAPLRIARGIQNKVLEAMAMGRVVVGSPEALAGLQVSPEVDVLQATTPDEWFYEIRKILESAELREQIELSARQYVEQHHSWAATLGPLNGLLRLEQRSASQQAQVIKS